jgi:hypothetical protein
MIILLNGPPSSGKDTAATFMKKYLLGSVREYKMSTTLKSGLQTLLGIEQEDWNRMLAYGAKDEPQLPLNITPREALIKLSEDYMKVLFGDNIFGHIAVRRLKRMVSADHILVTDTGFTYEAVPIVQEWGQKKVRILRLARPGCDFEDDSREYINVDVLGMTRYWKEINNQYDLELFEAQIKGVLKEWELIDD